MVGLNGKNKKDHFEWYKYILFDYYTDLSSSIKAGLTKEWSWISLEIVGCDIVWGPYKRTQTAALDAYLAGTAVDEVPQ